MSYILIIDLLEKQLMLKQFRAVESIILQKRLSKK